jgi:inner membrane protein
MASIVTHPAVPLALAVAYGRRYVSGRLLLAGISASILPDADAFGLDLGIPYGHLLGHRGLSHSILFALLLAVCAALLHRTLRSSRNAAFAVVFISCASHGLLDALTNGGLGVAFFSPLSNHRYFLPWHPIAVSPLDADLFFSDWGRRVLRSEALWVWLPCALVGGLGFLIRWGPKAGHALKRTAASASTSDMPGVSNAGSGASARCRRQSVS